jgi:hypothetical protein
MPINSEETSLFFTFGLKVLGWFMSFVAGIVTATWVVASKVKGFDDRLRSVEAAQTNCQNNIIGRIDSKLDRLHERIDDVLLYSKTRGEVDDDTLTLKNLSEE